MTTQTPSPPDRLRVPNDEHAPWLLRRIWDRLNKKNEHFMGAIVGQEGSGKSYTALKIADEVDPTFSDKRVIFDVAELLKRLKDGDHEPGYFYVLDEAGVQLGRRTWQERSQVLANQALQLIRDHNLGLVFTLPRLSEFDSQAQGRLQAALELTKKKDDEYVRGKWKFFDPNRMDDTGKIYKKYPRRRHNGQLKRIKTFAFTPPREELVRPYENRKQEFQERFYEEVINELEDSEEADSMDQMSVKEIAMEIADGTMEKYVSRHGQTKQPFINKELIRTDYEIPHSDARAVKSVLEQQFGSNELEAYA